MKLQAFFEGHYEDHEEIFEYVGEWYEGQHQPQPIILILNTAIGRVQTRHKPDIGNALPSRQWHDLDKIFYFPESVQAISYGHAEELLKEIRSVTDKLFESFHEVWDGQNKIGIWDEDLVEVLQKIIDDFSSDLILGWNEEE